MPKTFAIGDIHGAAKALQQCLDRCGFDYENDTLITLGDIVDGWPYVYECVEILLTIQNTINIEGNHDDWFREFIRTGVHKREWQQGGMSTRNSYARNAGLELWKPINPGDIPESHKEFFRNQLPYYTMKDYCFVHGGFDPDFPIDLQDRMSLIWDSNLWEQALSCTENKKIMMIDDFSRVFIGHTAVDRPWNGPLHPVKRGGVWNLDTGAGWYGKLTIMNVETEEFWQSDRVGEIYPLERGRG